VVAAVDQPQEKAQAGELVCHPETGGDEAAHWIIIASFSGPFAVLYPEETDMVQGVGPIELLVIAAMFAIVVWPTWRICSRAGFPGALSLLVLIPLANLFLLYFLAFAEWPALRLKKDNLDRDF
jgi:hypothetical protein